MTDVFVPIWIYKLEVLIKHQMDKIEDLISNLSDKPRYNVNSLDKEVALYQKYRNELRDHEK